MKAFSGPSGARYPDVLMQNALAQAAGAPGLLAPLSSTHFIFIINTALSSLFFSLILPLEKNYKALVDWSL